MKRIVVYLSVLAACLSVPLLAAADEKPDHEAMMKAYMEMSKPGPEHQMLAKLAGQWDYTMTSFEDPKNPMVTKGTSVKTMLMDGRFLKDETSGQMMDMPFVGMGMTGYNKTTKKYEGFWMDSMGTGIINMSGEGKGNTITSTFAYIDPVTNLNTNVKTVTTIVDPNKHTFTWYMIQGGQEVKAFEIEYVKKGA